MINVIWLFLIVVGILFGFFSGNIASINNEIFNSGKKSIDMILNIMPTMVIWMGIMKIAEDSGLLKELAKKISKFLRIIFPSIPKNHESFGYIASNIIVNVLGLGSAATPFGIKAMKSLQSINNKKDMASDAMITFLVLNTSGLTLIPTTIISLRILNKSSYPYIIIPSVIMATFASTFGGLVIDYIYRRRKK